MHLVISPMTGDNVLVDIAPTALVAELRVLVAAKLGLGRGAYRLWDATSGLELDDPAKLLADYSVQPLTTINVVLEEMADVPLSSPARGVDTTTAAAPLAADAASAAAAAPATAAATSVPSSSIVSESDMPRAVIVTGLPHAEEAVTEKALFDAFSPYGLISRLVLQDEPPVGAAAADGGVSVSGCTGTQRAIVVFWQDTAAAAALSVDGTRLMASPTPVRVLPAAGVVSLMAAMASAAPPSLVAASPVAAAAGGDASTAAGAVARLPPRASTVLAHYLASGYLHGLKGVAHVRAFDESHGVSTRVKVVVDDIVNAAGELNARYSILPTVRGAVEVVSTTALQAAAQAADIDRELGISTRVSSLTQAAVSRASMWAGRAMQNPTVAASVRSTRDFFAQAAAVVAETYEQAKAEAAAAQAAAAAAAATPAAGGTAIAVVASGSQPTVAVRAVPSAASVGAAPQEAVAASLPVAPAAVATATAAVAVAAADPCQDTTVL